MDSQEGPVAAKGLLGSPSPGLISFYRGPPINPEEWVQQGMSQAERQVAGGALLGHFPPLSAGSGGRHSPHTRTLQGGPRPSGHLLLALVKPWQNLSPATLL